MKLDQTTYSSVQSIVMQATLDLSLSSLSCLIFGLVHTCVPALKAGSPGQRQAWLQLPWKGVVLATLSPPLHLTWLCLLAARSQSHPQRSQLCSGPEQPLLIHWMDFRNFSSGKPDTQGPGWPHCRYNNLTSEDANTQTRTHPRTANRKAGGKETGWKRYHEKLEVKDQTVKTKEGWSGNDESDRKCRWREEDNSMGLCT